MFVRFGRIDTCEGRLVDVGGATTAGDDVALGNGGDDSDDDAIAALFGVAPSDGRLTEKEKINLFLTNKHTPAKEQHIPWLRCSRAKMLDGDDGRRRRLLQRAR